MTTSRARHRRSPNRSHRRDRSRREVRAGASAPGLRRVLRRPLPARRVPAFLISALLAGALLGCAGDRPLEEAEAVAPPVEALPARSGTLPLSERLNGLVRADNQLVVRPEVSGRVVEVLVRSGDAVEKGRPLVRLEPQGLREQLRQAEAEVRLAEAATAAAHARVSELEAEVTRTRRLAAEELVSTMELETQEARLDAAQAAAAQAEVRVEQAAAAADERRFDLDRAVVRAPISGRVGRREVEVGTVVDPATALFVLGDLSDLVVEIPLTEDMLSFIEEGQPVRVTPRSGPAGRGASASALSGIGRGGEVRATLSRISPFLDAGSFTTVGEIDLEGSALAAGLRPGMFVTVDVLYGESETATLVPASALWDDPRTGVRGIYVFPEPPRGMEEPSPSREPAEGEAPADPSVEAFRVKFEAVEVVAAGRAVVGIVGVDPGDWVVVLGQHLLSTAQEADGSALARVRATSWDRILELQDLQREDLLASFLDKQQRLGREQGAEPPSNSEFLRPLAAGGGAAGEGGS